MLRHIILNLAGSNETTTGSNLLKFIKMFVRVKLNLRLVMFKIFAKYGKNGFYLFFFFNKID